MGYNFKKALAVLAASAMSMSVLASYPVDTFHSLVVSASEEALETEMLLVSDAESLPDNEELFAGYVEQAFYGGGGISLFSVGNRTAGSQLTGDEKAAYDALVPIIKAIASGERASTVVAIGQDVRVQTEAGDIEDRAVDAEATFTDTIDNFDYKTVIASLLSDYPYEMYWFDKTVGYSISPVGSPLKYLKFSFTVASAYADTTAKYTADTSKTGATTKAVANANAIVAANENKNDYEKLVAYRDAICDAVTYNHAAADDEDTPYGDPWQLIYAFDGNADTNIVCEGYAKAFQYLCDQSTFSGEIACYSVTGTMDGGTGAGGHMWNIVTMEDGNNYIVDVTNSDEGSIGQDGGLFLNGVTGSVESGYAAEFKNSSVTFIYDDDIKTFWGTDADSILNLSAEDYTFSYQAAVLNEAGVYEISNASQLYWFAGLVNGTLDGVKQDVDADAILMNDIVVNQNVLNDAGTLNGDGSAFTAWVPIGVNSSTIYQGIFDGNGYTISGLYVNDSENQNSIGLVGNAMYSTIQNVTIIDSYFLNDALAGAVCGDNGGDIINCHADAAVNGFSNVGGVCGNNNGTIANSSSTGFVTGSRQVGGIVGYSGGTVINCYHTGTVTATNYSAGGIVGEMTNGSIENCYNSGQVSASKSSVGGVCGDSNGHTITSSYYLAGSSYDSTSGTALTEAQMKAAAGTDGSLVDALNTSAESYNGTSPEVAAFSWVQTDTYNDGYPVFGGSITYMMGTSHFTEWVEGYTPVTSYISALGAVLPTADDVELAPGYVFNGWYEQNGGGTIVTEIAKGTNGNKVYVAKTTFSCTDHDFDCTVTDGISTRSCSICGYSDKITVPTEFALYWNKDGGNSYSSKLSGNLCIGNTLKMWVHGVTTGVDNYEMVVEVSDPSVAQYTFSRYYTTEGANDTMGSFACLSEGTTEIKVYPKYNPDLVKTVTLTVAHTDEDSDGICDSCGAYEDNIGVLSGTSISLKGNVGLNFYMQLDDSVAQSETAYMQFTLPSGEVTKVPVKDITPTTTDDGTYYVFPFEVAAAEMTDEITAQIFLSEDDDEGGTVYTYSVKQYADYLLANTETNAEYAAAEELVKAMLNYGAYSQTYFEHNTDTLANAALADTDKVLADVSVADAYAAVYSASGLPDGVTYYGTSLVLLSNTVIRHYFVIDGETIPEVSEGWSELTKSGNYYYTEMTNVAAAELDVMQVLNIDEWTISYSALSYAKSMLGSSDEGLNDVLTALYHYNQAANSYFDAIA